VVNDEAAGGAEASWPEMGMVAVPGKDEQLGAFGGGDDLTLDSPGPLDLGTGAAQAIGGRRQELAGGGGGQAFQARAGVALGVAASEQSGERAVRGAGDVVVADVEQDDLDARRGVGAGGVNASGPAALGNPDDNGHGFTLR